MCGLIFVCVLFSEFIVCLPTNTHLGTLIQISHHTHTPPCRYTSSTPALFLGCYHSLLISRPLIGYAVITIINQLRPVPSRPVPSHPPHPHPPAIHNKLRDHLLWLQSTDWQAVWGVCRIYGFSGCSVSHLLPSSRPSPSYGLLEKNQHKFSLFEGWGQQLDSKTDGI